MFFLFGENHSKGQVFKHNEFKCPKCSNNGIIIQEALDYVTFWFVPIFQSGKSFIGFCQECENIVHHNKFSFQDKEISKSFTHETKRPFWHNLGIFLIVGYIIFMIIYDALIL